MQLLVLESTNDDPVQKSSVKGIGAVTTVTKSSSSTALDPRNSRTATNGLERSNTLEHTNSNNSVQTVSSGTRLAPAPTNDTDARSMYPFRVKHLGKTEVYTLYAPTAQNRQDWCEAIIEAKTRHAASLYAQNAEPFRLRVLADTAFGYDGATNISRSITIKGTPLDRAIKEAESKYEGQARPGPVCRSAVNCATVFNQPHGRLMCAIGTDFGVFMSEYENPRG